ncbi:MAG: hypothetical protein Q8R36_00080 [bacterium]|nr:hypothetical protein [bacterium]
MFKITKMKLRGQVRCIYGATVTPADLTAERNPAPRTTAHQRASRWSFGARIVLIAGILILPFVLTKAAPPTNAVKFVILNPADSIAGTSVTVTVEAQKSNNQVDTSYQNDVTLVTSGSATGGGLVNIVNGVGTTTVNDLVAETVTLSLSDTQSTGLNVSSTQNVVFAAAGGSGGGETPSWRQSDYWFRDDDGSETGASGWGRENLLLNTTPNLTKQPREEMGRFRLRIGLRLTKADDAISPQLEYALEGVGSDNCASNLNWRALSDSSGRYILRASSYFSDSSSTTQQITSGSGFVSGLLISATTTNPAPSVTLLKNDKTEYEWMLEDTGPFVNRERYIFRVTDAGSPLDTYQNCPNIAFPPETSGGVQPTIVSFSGKAFPGGKIFIVDKDARFEKVLSRDEIIAEDGTFKTDFIGVLQGQHGFGLVIKDSEGRKTQSKFFNIDTVSNSLTVKEILVPPTIDFMQGVVRRGESVAILGYASPLHIVQVEIDGKIKKQAKVHTNGSYKIEVPTGELEFGPHKVVARQIDAHSKKKSDASPLRTFTVSRLERVKTDFNSDNVIDIRDWSIFLSRWGSKDTVERTQVDLNGDGKIDISDFSIFIRSVRKK